MARGRVLVLVVFALVLGMAIGATAVTLGRPGSALRATTGQDGGAGGAAPGPTPSDRALAEGPRVRVVAVGDIACAPQEQRGAEQCAQQQTSDLALQLAPDAVLALGDLQYERATADAFEASYDPTWGRLKGITRPAPGNHEYQGDEKASAYYDYFGAAAGPDRRGWYSFDLGAWHVVSLNSNCSEAGGCSAGSPQGRWLAQDLAADDHRCTLAFWHHPRWSNSEHGDYERVGPLVSMLHAEGVELLLTGHEHIYERFAPRAPDGSDDPARGVRELVVGTGGRSFYGLDRRDGLEAWVTHRFGVLDLTLAGSGYAWAFRTVDGAVADSGSAACH